MHYLKVYKEENNENERELIELTGNLTQALIAMQLPECNVKLVRIVDLLVLTIENIYKDDLPAIYALIERWCDYDELKIGRFHK
jgi:hypothetical protein